MDTKRAVFLGAAGVALLTLTYLWIGTGRSARPEPASRAVAAGTSEPSTSRTPPDAREPAGSTEAAVEDDEDQTIEAPRAAPPSDHTPRPRAEPSSSAEAKVLRLLEDEDYLAACEDLAGFATPRLEDLVEETQRAVQDWQGELCIQRAEAGLYEPLPGYEAGKPFELHLDEGDLLQSFYSAGLGDGNLVELPREEYPELYTLWDASKRFQKELRKRKSAEARGRAAGG